MLGGLGCPVPEADAVEIALLRQQLALKDT
jgi:hypothetical protein